MRVASVGFPGAWRRGSRHSQVASLHLQSSMDLLLVRFTLFLLPEQAYAARGAKRLVYYTWYMYIYMYIYYWCKSFAVLLYHNVMVGGWIASWVSLLYYNTYCCTAVVQGCGWVDRFVTVVCCWGMCPQVRGLFSFSFFFLPLYRPRAGIVQRTTMT